MNKTKRFTQLVLVEPDNCPPYVDLVASNRKITLERAWHYYEQTAGFNEDIDAITFLDRVYPVTLEH